MIPDPPPSNRHPLRSNADPAGSNAEPRRSNAERTELNAERTELSSGRVPRAGIRRDPPDDRSLGGLGIMAKYWEPGRVKTRLGVSVGMERAADLHRIFVVHLCDVLAGIDADKQVVVAPDEKCADVAAALPPSWSVAGQGSGDLGRRMARRFQDRLDMASERDCSPGSPDRPRVVLIGGDCLTVGPNEIADAFETLAEHDVVLGPSVDGGYYLIGIAGRWDPARDSLFENVPWGTGRVAEITRRRVAAAKLSIAELAPMEDVDTIDELNRLRESLAARQPVRGEPVRGEPDRPDLLRRSIDAALARRPSKAPTPPADGWDWETSR